MLIFWQQICVIPELLSGQELPPFLDDKLKSCPQLISNEIPHYVPNFLLLCSKVSRL